MQPQLESVVCVSTRGCDLADGRPIGPGETQHDVDVFDTHNRQLLDDGRLSILPAPTPAPDLTKLGRPALDAMALQLGVANAAELSNKGAVIAAIKAAHAADPATQEGSRR
jgi:hypothetical protein